MGKRWSNEQIEFLKANFMRMSNEELEKHLGYSVKSITTQMSRLGLCRSKWIKEKISKGNGNNNHSNNTSPLHKKALNKFYKAVELFRKEKYTDARSEFEIIMHEFAKELLVYERARVYFNICCRMAC